MPNSLSALHILHAWENNPIYLKCVQGENGIKIAKFQLVDDNGAIDLTNNTGVVFMGTSGNGSAVSVNCTVDNATEGKISLSASTNFTNAIGRTVGNIVVNFSNDNIQFDGINIKVTPNKAIEALIRDETFATFLSALSRLQDIESGEVTEIDTALDENSTNPVQNSAVAVKINEIINNFDNYVETISGVTLDNCTQPNQWYKVYITSANTSGWTGVGGYHNALCVTATNQITQYVLTQNGGVVFRSAPATSGTKSGNWGEFKSFVIKGTKLSDYGITDAYNKNEVYNKDEIEAKLYNLSESISDNANDIDNLSETTSQMSEEINSQNTAIGEIQNDINNQSASIEDIIVALTGKMSKDYLSTTSFMCDEYGTIFSATDDTVLTNRSFENQNKTTNPYFIWIAKTVTEVENNAFVNTGKIAKIYCENTSANTPLPSNYQSLPVEYGYNSLFTYYLFKSVVNLFNNKVNKSEVYTVDTMDSTFERVANKSDTFTFDRTPTSEERLLFPTVARMKEFVFTTFYNRDEVDDLIDTINESIATKADSDSVYEKTVIDQVVSDIMAICDALNDSIEEKLSDSDNVIKTKHITDGNVTEQKLSSDVINKINRVNAVYSYTIPYANWDNNVQTLTLPATYTVTSNTKVDIEGDDSVIDQLVIDDCAGLYVENDNGVLTLHAINNSPTANITVQLMAYEVKVLN